MHQGVQKFLVRIDKRAQFSRHWEYDMVIRTVDHFRTAGIDPAFLQDSLTGWTTAIAAGVVMDRFITAFLTNADAAAEGTGFTGHDGKGRFVLNRRNGMRLCVRIPGSAEDLLYFQFSQQDQLPSGQKD